MLRISRFRNSNVSRGPRSGRWRNRLFRKPRVLYSLFLLRTDGSQLLKTPLGPQPLPDAQHVQSGNCPRTHSVTQPPHVTVSGAGGEGTTVSFTARARSTKPLRVACRLPWIEPDFAGLAAGLCPAAPRPALCETLTRPLWRPPPVLSPVLSGHRDTLSLLTRPFRLVPFLFANLPGFLLSTPSTRSLLFLQDTPSIDFTMLFEASVSNSSKELHPEEGG